MSRADQIRRLQDQTVADIDTVYTYHGDSQVVWTIVKEFIATGQEFAESSRASLTGLTFSNLEEKSKRYVGEYLAEATFQQFLAIFENFFFDLFRLWLTAYRQSLGQKRSTLQRS